MHKALFSLLGISTSLVAAQNYNCDEPTDLVTCYPDDCTKCYCLGPENYIVNPPVCPRTCNGDIIFQVSALYWHADQDGMEYAIDNNVINPKVAAGAGIIGAAQMEALNRLVDADYTNPDFKWDWGFKFGIGYCTACDGWDIGITWTWYRGKATSHDEAELNDNHTLLPLWSAFVPTQGYILYVTDIETNWKLQLNLIDIELGRNFWISNYLSIRPNIGLRISYIYQDFNIEHKGGSYGARTDALAQPAYVNNVNMNNDFKGIGLRSGVDTTWNFGCGWAIYGNLAVAIVYGRFNIDHDEWNREAEGNHAKIKILETENSFKASRGMLDFSLGFQWKGMFNDCKYGLTLQLGWEQHLFFHQNQFWKVTRFGDIQTTSIPNNLGENDFNQTRGTLETEGVTFTMKFDF